MDKEEALRRLSEIQGLVKYFGNPDQDSLQKLVNHVGALRSHGPADSDYRYELDELEDWAREGFSFSKFAKYPGGLRHVQSRVLGNCSAIQHTINNGWPA